jgi:hypothetical protein
MKIPSKTETSLKQGNWFIYYDNFNTIAVWSSNLNGKEKIFLNNKLVSEQRSIRKKSKHNFTDDKGKEYNVKFEVKSLKKCNLECIISSENTLLKTFETEYVKGKNFLALRLIIYIVALITFVLCSSYFKLPDWTFILFIITSLIIHFMTSNKGEVIIKEEQRLSNTI